MFEWNYQMQISMIIIYNVEIRLEFNEIYSQKVQSHFYYQFNIQQIKKIKIFKVRHSQKIF